MLAKPKWCTISGTCCCKCGPAKCLNNSTEISRSSSTNMVLAATHPYGVNETKRLSRRERCCCHWWPCYTWEPKMQKTFDFFAKSIINIHEIGKQNFMLCQWLCCIRLWTSILIECAKETSYHACWCLGSRHHYFIYALYWMVTIWTLVFQHIYLCILHERGISIAHTLKIPQFCSHP